LHPFIAKPYLLKDAQYHASDTVVDPHVSNAVLDMHGSYPTFIF